MDDAEVDDVIAWCRTMGFTEYYYTSNGRLAPDFLVAPAVTLDIRYAGAGRYMAQVVGRVEHRNMYSLHDVVDFVSSLAP